MHNRGGSTTSASTTSGVNKVHLKFNFNTGQKFQYDPDKPSVNEFNLNHTYSDKAYLRQPLAFEYYDRCGSPGSESFLMRAHRNGQFHAVMAFIEEPEEEMLEREGLDPRGALYKMYNQFTSPSGEKKTRRWEGSSDLSGFMNGMNQTGTARHNYIFDAVDMPRMISYLVATVITHQNDHPHKNHYLYRDSEGSGEWFFMPWDHDLTWGSNWTGSSYHDYIYAADDQIGKGTSVKPSHPFIGKEDCQEWNWHWNRLTDKLLNDMTFRQMYLRRLRTVMDDILKAPGTPYNELVIENRIDEIVAQARADIEEDYLKWVSPAWEAVSQCLAGILMRPGRFGFGLSFYGFRCSAEHEAVFS
jgi:spore coat protein CotH